MSRPTPTSFAVLGIAVAAVSSGAIFTRLAEAPPLLVAACRTGIAALALGLFVGWARREEFQSLDRGQLRGLILAGLLLAIHFAAWITSLGMTTVAASVVLVSTTPFWVALLAPRWTSDRVTRRMALGIGLGLIGSLVVGGSDFAGGSQAWLGDALAVIGGMAAAGYIVLGRRLRAGMSLPVYGASCYGIAAIVLAFAMATTGESAGGLQAEQWGWIAMVGLVPQLIGHSSYNWALGHVSAPLVSLSLIGEPVLAAMLAWLVFGERLADGTLVGGALILGGIAIAAWPTRTAEPAANPKR